VRLARDGLQAVLDVHFLGFANGGSAVAPEGEIGLCKTIFDFA